MTTINHDGTLAPGCGVYNRESMLGMNFLDESHREIESKKYNLEICAKCYANGLPLSPMPKAYQDIISAKVEAVVAADRECHPDSR